MPTQSLIKTPADAGQSLAVGGRPLTAAHEQLVGILRQRLGQSHGELLATPKLLADGSTAWSTALTAPALAAADLPAEEHDKLQQRAERLLEDIRGLAGQLRNEGPAAVVVAQMLEQASQSPPGDWLYSLGGKTVLVMWGHAAPGAVPTPMPTPMQTSLPTPTTASAAAAIASPASAAVAAHRRWQRWLPWVLLGLLSIAALLWGLKSCADGPAVDPALDERLAQAEARNQALESELANKRNAKPQMMCMAEPAASAPSAPPAVAAASAPEPPASAVAMAPPPPPNPIDELKRRVAAAGKNCDTLSALLKNDAVLKGSGKEASALKQQVLTALQANCREQVIKEARNQCPGQRPKELAPEMAIVFDASGSMRFSLDVTEAQIRSAGQAAALEGMMRQFGLGGPGAGVLEQLTREPTRISAARRATLAVVGRLPSDMNTGLVLVEQCPSARSVGMYSPAERAALLGQIQGIQPRQGTPLADGIAKAGRLVDGVTRESTILVISDGTESCGGDPCAVAAALKRAKPHLTINVVDITGTGAGNCVAQATGGKVFTATNANELIAQTERAARDAMGPANCKR